MYLIAHCVYLLITLSHSNVNPTVTTFSTFCLDSNHIGNEMLDE